MFFRSQESLLLQVDAITSERNKLDAIIEELSVKLSASVSSGLVHKADTVKYEKILSQIKLQYEEKLSNISLQRNKDIESLISQHNRHLSELRRLHKAAIMKFSEKDIKIFEKDDNMSNNNATFENDANPHKIILDNSEETTVPLAVCVDFVSKTNFTNLSSCEEDAVDDAFSQCFNKSMSELQAFYRLFPESFIYSDQSNYNGIIPAVLE